MGYKYLDGTNVGLSDYSCTEPLGRIQLDSSFSIVWELFTLKKKNLTKQNLILFVFYHTGMVGINTNISASCFFSSFLLAMRDECNSPI